MRETLRATEVLVKEGFEPMVYCVDDPIAAKQLEEAGAVAIMPLGAPIGSGLGIQNRVTIRLIVEGASVPVLVDAGVGTASDAAVAMELGCDGVLMNTAIAEAKDPVLMARGDEGGGRSRTPVLPRRADAEAALRRSEQPARWIDLRRIYACERRPQRPRSDNRGLDLAYFVAVTMCADMGASIPSGPSKRRKACSTAAKTWSRLPGSRSSTSTPIGVP